MKTAVHRAFNLSKSLILLKKVLAGEPGFEPGLTESESVGLPLTYSPAGSRISVVSEA